MGVSNPLGQTSQSAASKGAGGSLGKEIGAVGGWKGGISTHGHEQGLVKKPFSASIHIIS